MVGELGGLHYCIVLNKDDKLSFGTLNVIPLTSIKENKVYHNNTVNLGDEIYTILYNKFQKSFNDSSLDSEFLNKFEKEITKMKKGSIALVNQITTISKQRIYYPKSSKDLLAGVRLSNSSLDLLDKKINELFTK